MPSWPRKRRGLNQPLSTSALWTFWAGSFFAVGAVLCASERFPLDGSGIPQVGQPNLSSDFAQSPLGQARPPSLRTSELQHFCSSGPMGPRPIGPRSSFPFHLPASPEIFTFASQPAGCSEERLQADPALSGEEMLTTPALAFLPTSVRSQDFSAGASRCVGN